MIARIWVWLLVLAVVWFCLGSPISVPTSRTNADETFQRVGDELRAGLSASAVAQLHSSLGLTDTVRRLQEGKVDNQAIPAVAAILRNTSEINIHRMRGGSNNTVYLSPDRHSEAVYDSDGRLVKDGINDGSYNYFDPQRDALRHFSVDIAPWLLFGLSRNDPTSQAERVHAYSADVFDGVVRALEAPRAKLGDVDLDEPGCVEAVAIFLLAIERGNAEELIRVVNRKEKKSDRELIQLVGRFEAGLQALIASDKGQ